MITRESELAVPKEFTASVEEVAAVFHKTPETIRVGLQQRVFPWGYAIQTSEGRWSYIINRKRFEQIEMVELKGEKQ